MCGMWIEAEDAESQGNNLLRACYAFKVPLLIALNRPESKLPAIRSQNANQTPA